MSAREAKAPAGATIVERLAGIVPGSQLAVALDGRAEILARTEASHDAILRPRDPGGFGHAERAALAARMARLLGDDAMAAHYDSLLPTDASSALADLAQPDADAPADPRLAAIVRHVDLLTMRPRDARRIDIEALRAAGIGEPDIVRLSQLVAFVNYQARLIAGLRLLGAMA